jgi:hypothetical protein
VPIKHILAPPSGDHATQHLFLCARNLAEELGAHVTGTIIRMSGSAYVIPRMTIPLGTANGSLKTSDAPLLLAKS